MKRWQDGDYLFDGFAHRRYAESTDGWRNSMPDPESYACMQLAQSVLDMFQDFGDARRRIWELENEVAQLRSLRDAYL